MSPLTHINILLVIIFFLNSRIVFGKSLKNPCETLVVGEIFDEMGTIFN